MDTLSSRDRLLLAFANLGSYGIVARPAMRGTLAQARAAVAAETRLLAPFAQTDYVFWLHDDEIRTFATDGALIADLDIYVGNASLIPAVDQHLVKAGIPGRSGIAPQCRLISL